MIPKDFVAAYYPFAKQTQDKTGISAIAILAQAALESGWGSSAPGNMFFGIKDTDGVNGNEQLLKTSEYLATNTVKFPQILSVTWDSTKKLYHYLVKDYFRKYDTPEQCFTDHANFFFNNSRYAMALTVRQDPFLFTTEVANAGYATAPGYSDLLHKIINVIKQYV